MKLNKLEFVDKLKQKAMQIDVAIDDKKAEQLYFYKELMLEYNKNINLTAIVEDDEIIVKHFVDSLTVVKLLNGDENIIDVGTGAGFPGVVLAIYFDKSKVVLLDALEKRIMFLKQVVEKLDLINIVCIHGRAEEMAHKAEYREKFDVAIARAVASCNILAELVSGFIKVNGKCVLMKSDKVNEELQVAKKAFNILKLNLSNVEQLEIQDFNNNSYVRNLVILKKIEQLNVGYPRLFSKIKKIPL